MGFPDSSAGKQSTCNAGDLGSIPGLGKTTHSSILAWRILWTVQVAQTVKSLPTNAGDTTGAGSIPGFGRSLEDGIETHSSIFDGESHGQRSLEGYSPWSRKESDTIEHTQHRCIFTLKKKKNGPASKRKRKGIWRKGSGTLTAQGGQPGMSWRGCRREACRGGGLQGP